MPSSDPRDHSDADHAARHADTGHAERGDATPWTHHQGSHAAGGATIGATAVEEEEKHGASTMQSLRAYALWGAMALGVWHVYQRDHDTAFLIVGGGFVLCLFGLTHSALARSRAVFLPYGVLAILASAVGLVWAACTTWKWITVVIGALTIVLAALILSTLMLQGSEDPKPARRDQRVV